VFVFKALDPFEISRCACVILLYIFWSSRSGWLTYMKDVLDTSGSASAKAQGLPAAITTFERVQNFEHVVYIITKKGNTRLVKEYSISAIQPRG
jgi:hypothetical protein